DAVALEAVHAAAPGAPHGDEPGGLEHAEMAGRRRPAVCEALREIARGQLAAQMREQLDDVAPGLVRQRRERSLDLAEAGRHRDVRRLAARHTLLLALLLTISKTANERRQPRRH